MELGLPFFGVGASHSTYSTITVIVAPEAIAGRFPRSQPSPAHSRIASDGRGVERPRAARAIVPSRMASVCPAEKRETIAPGGIAIRKSPTTGSLPALK